MDYGPAMNGPPAGYYRGQGYIVTRNVPFDGNLQHLNEQNYSRGHEPQRNYVSNASGPPPPYHQGNPWDMQKNADPRPAQHSHTVRSIGLKAIVEKFDCDIWVMALNF